MAYFHVFPDVEESAVHPVVRRIGLNDIRSAFIEGFRDFLSMPSHVAFVGILYPIAGICVTAATSNLNAFYLIYPLVSGFALIGPFAATIIYEMSRRRELGLPQSWLSALTVVRSPTAPSILLLALLLAVIFIAWLESARTIYMQLFGGDLPQNFGQLFDQVFETSRGLELIVVGNLVGFIFAVLALSISVVSFPLIVDREAGAATAIATSVRTLIRNPLEMALWGAAVTTLLAVGFAMAVMGLAIVMPVVGHASWRLYRRVVAPVDSACREG